MSPLFERFTQRARQLVVLAQDEARTLGHNYVGTEHLLLAVLRDKEDLAARLLQARGIDFSSALTWVEKNVGRGTWGAARSIAFTPRAKRALELALRDAVELGHEEIDTEHVLRALTRVEDGLAVRILIELGAEPQAVADEAVRALPPRP